MAGKKWSEETKENARIKRYGRKGTLLEDYLEIASKFEDANVFRKVHYKIHTYIRQKGMLDVAFPNRKKYKPKGYWTPETIREESKKYSTRTQFLENNQVAFNTSLKHIGLLDELFPKKEHYSYTFEESKKICDNFKSRMDLAKNNNKLYLYVKSNGWLPDLYPDMRYHKRSKYTIESVTEIAKKYNFISDFVRNHPGPYDFAYRNNLLPTLFTERKHKWTDERIKEELSKYQSKREVSTLNPSLYNTANRKGILNEVFSHHTNINWTEQSILEELSKYESRHELYRKNPSLYQIARVGKYLDKSLPNNKKIKWTDDRIVTELNKFKNRKEVYRKNFNLYQVSIKSGHLNLIHPKLKNDKNRNINVNFDYRP
jgi:hypothetical protein